MNISCEIRSPLVHVEDDGLDEADGYGFFAFIMLVRSEKLSRCTVVWQPATILVETGAEKIGLSGSSSPRLIRSLSAPKRRSARFRLLGIG